LKYLPRLFCSNTTRMQISITLNDFLKGVIVKRKKLKLQSTYNIDVKILLSN